jgi:hypothetical protein
MVCEIGLVRELDWTKKPTKGISGMFVAPIKSAQRLPGKNRENFVFLENPL